MTQISSLVSGGEATSPAPAIRPSAAGDFFNMGTSPIGVQLSPPGGVPPPTGGGPGPASGGVGAPPPTVPPVPLAPPVGVVAPPAPGTPPVGVVEPPVPGE